MRGAGNDDGSPNFIICKLSLQPLGRGEGGRAKLMRSYQTVLSSLCPFIMYQKVLQNKQRFEHSSKSPWSKLENDAKNRALLSIFF